MKYRTILTLILLLAAAMCTGARKAEAGLRFCNQGNIKFVVAVGYIDREKGWVAKGWATIENGECKDAIKTPLDNRYYYFHATGRAPDQSLVEYGGEVAFCVQSAGFVIYQAEYGKSNPEDCARTGLRSEKFKKIDTNLNPDWTVNLGSAANSAGPPSGAMQAPPAPQPPMASGAVGRPPANVQSLPPPSVVPNGGGGSACQRYPNLC